MRAGKLTFVPEIVGSHWAQDAQMDVVAVNWREKAILLGECKWGVDAVGRSILQEFLGKSPLVLQALPEGGAGWAVDHALYARAGFTEAAQAPAWAVHILLVDLARLAEDPD